MKKITQENYTTDAYYAKIAKAATSVLQSDGFVSPLRVFMAMGLLSQQDVAAWEKGHMPYLEKSMQCDLSKAGKILRILRFYAHDLELKPSRTVYKSNAGKGVLKFSKSGEKKFEEAYCRHFIRPGDAGKRQLSTPDGEWE